MKVSICIPTFNRPDYLRETLDSCLAQTVLPYEIVIGDDSKNDETEKFIESYTNNTGVLINYHHHNPPLKQAENTNFLFQKAKGEKLLLIHDDDLLMPEALETLMSVLQKDSSLKIAFGKSYIMLDSGRIDYKASEHANNYFYKNERFEGSVLSPIETGIIQQFPNNGYLIDTELARSVPWRTTALGIMLGTGNELDFGLRIGLKGSKMYFINKYLVKYRINPISISTSLKDDGAYKSYLVLKNTEIDFKYDKIKNIALKRKASLGVVQALNLENIEDALKIFFSKNHLKLVHTLGFYKRFIKLSRYLIINGYKNSEKVKV